MMITQLATTNDARERERDVDICIFYDGTVDKEANKFRARWNCTAFNNAGMIQATL